MRITCPNCDAQYEVPDAVIPPEGRDVQCSNCGNTWFQPAASAKVLDAELEADPDFLPEPEPDVAPDPAPNPNVATSPDAPPPSTATDPNPAPKPGAADGATQEAGAEPEPHEPPQPVRRSLDPEVAEILRQEADREIAARSTDPAPIETQPDLGIAESGDEQLRRAREARERMAKIRGEAPDTEAEFAETEDLDTPLPDTGNVGEEAAVAAALGSRRELLPDVEEINSSLRSTGDREGAEDAQIESPARKRRGFRRGFAIAILLIALALGVYVFAPEIAEAVPESDPLLSTYVNWVDGLRLQLETQVLMLSQWLADQAASLGE